jgi:hypothetical protein
MKFAPGNYAPPRETVCFNESLQRLQRQYGGADFKAQSGEKL